MGISGLMSVDSKGVGHAYSRRRKQECEASGAHVAPRAVTSGTFGRRVLIDRVFSLYLAVASR
jgi:hypothetical protein